MVLLGDVGLVESRFGLFGDSISVVARWVHGLHQTYQRLRNCFGRTRWNSYVTWVVWNLVLPRLEAMLVSLLERYMVCAK
jgi:hypothetical protein